MFSDGIGQQGWKGGREGGRREGGKEGGREGRRVEGGREGGRESTHHPPFSSSDGPLG